MGFTKKLLSLVALLSLISVSAAAATPAQAEREGIGLSPTTFKLEGNPGERIDSNFTVLNGGSQPLRYRVYVSDFSITNEDYEKNFEKPIADGLSPLSWFTLPDQGKDLAADGQVKLPFSLTIPADAVPRGYYAVIFAETVPSNPDKTGVARVKRVGSLVYLTVKGGVTEKGRLLSFEAKAWQYKSPVKTEVRVQNDGNTHFDAKGEVRLKDVFGRTVSTSRFEGTLLPSTIRKFSPELPVSLPLGVYKVEGNLKFTDQAVSLDAKWVVVTSPFWLLVALVVVAAWLAIIILWIRRRARPKQV